MIENKRPKFFYGYVIVLAAFVILAVGIGGINSFGVFLEPLLVEFGWTRAVTSGAFSLGMLLLGLLSIVSGILADRFGPRLVLTAGGFFVGLGYLLMSQISGIWQLYLFYGVIMGIGMSSVYVPSVSTIARWFVKRRGMMTGIALASIGAGTMIMPLLAGWLISSYGWRISFIAMGIIVLALMISATQFLRRDPQSRGQLPDGSTEVGQESSNLEDSGLSLREAIHTRQLWMLGAIFLCLGFSAYAIITHIVIHATDLGIPVTSAVNILAIIGGLNIAGRIVIGGAADRIGSRRALIIGIVLLSISLLWLLIAKELWMLYLFAAIFGFTHAVLVLLSPVVAELFGLSSHGVIMGFTDASCTIGVAIGPVLAGYIFDVTGSYQLGFLIVAAVSFIGLILALFLKPISSRK